MRRLFLHVGTGKTGSTALQQAFSKATMELATAGISYPEHPRLRERILRGIPVAGNAGRITRALRAREWARAATELRTLLGGLGDILLSNEGLSANTTQELQVIANLAAELGFETKVLVFFRPQTELLASAYLQRLKANEVTEDIDEYAVAQLKSGRTDWLACAQKLETVFGQVQVRWYPSVLRGRGVIAEGFDWLGAQAPNFITKINPSPGRETALILMEANKAGFGGRLFADRFLNEADDRGWLGSKVVLDEAVARKIESESRASNDELMRRYCPNVIPEEPVRVKPRPIDEQLLRKLHHLAAAVAAEIGIDPAAIQSAFETKG